MNIYLIGIILISILAVFIGIQALFRSCCNCSKKNNYTEI